ncbi:MAG: hypothetical protein HYY78_13180 [Betaproteobacteria bacterium]|nr:hypothetical protein [Betaproteobacteria bacterium]
MPDSRAMMTTGKRRLLPAVACALLIACPLASPVGAAEGAAGADPGSQQRLDSTARLIAGLPPSHPDHAELARSREWQQHSRAIQSSWTRVRDGQIAAMTAWREAELPAGCPVGRTLLYPFSGPDFLNAHGLFPDCSTLVLFGLERIGEVPDVGSMSSQEFTRLLTNARGFLINLFARNYFVTDTMQKALRSTEQLRGVVPVFMVLMALSGAEVLRVAPLKLEPAPGAKPPGEGLPAAGGRKRVLRGVSIDFRNAGSAQVRRLNYFSLDATDAAITAYPEFLDYLRSLGPTTTLIKSASYLLHGNEFRRVREAILETSRFLVQDDTGLPYARLVKRGWQVRVYGVYNVPIPPFENAYQTALAAAYVKQKPKPLPFRFGYQLNQVENRSNLMVARLPDGQGQPGGGPGAR